MWSAIEPIGREASTGGYRRFAWTPADATLREWFAGEASARGLDLVTDCAGNQWAWWGDPDAAVTAGRPGVVIGSHLDSVPDGGDGSIGITPPGPLVPGAVSDQVQPAARRLAGEPLAQHRVRPGPRKTSVAASTRLATDGLDYRPHAVECHRVKRHDLNLGDRQHSDLSLIHISEPTRRTPISYAVFCLK